MASTRSKSAHASKLREGGVAMNMKKIGVCTLVLSGALLLCKGGSRNEEKTRLLQEIQSIIEEDDRKTERLFKPPQ